MVEIIIVIIGIIISLAIQGWMIMNGAFDYRKDPKIPPTNNHPEMNDHKPGDGLLFAKFDNLDVENLRLEAAKMKMDELFQEPSSFEDEDDDDSGYCISRR